METKIGKMKKFSRNERTKEILETVSRLGAILFLGVFAPNAAGHIIKLLGWAPDGRTKYRTERVISSLEKRELIRFWTKGGKGRLELTPAGKMYLAGLRVKSIKLPLKGKKWDGLWRIVTFDIPEKLKINRKRFAKTLNSAGMYNLEKSIFVYPHECREEIFKIADLFEVRKYVKYVIAKSIEPDLKLKSNFVFTRR